MKPKQVIGGLLALALTIIVFTFIFQRVDIAEVWAVLSNASLLYVLLSFFVTVLLIMLAALRWQAILSSANIKITLLESAASILGAFPLNTITPSKAGDLMRLVILKNKGRPSKILGSLLIERLTDVLMLGLLCFIGYFFFMSPEILIAGSVSVLLVVGAFALAHLSIPLPSCIAEKVNRVSRVFRILLKDRKAATLVFLNAMAHWALSMVQVWIFFRAVGVTIPFVQVLARAPLGIIIGSIPVTIAGMGTRDLVYVYLFSSWASEAEIVAMGVLFAFFRYWLIALAGIPVMLYLAKKNKGFL